ncbi:unnamed protein product [Dracunculus medinensis]|uniref:Large ribosomal subunit protein uL10 n=1 Tax=Dracunculus medinensis TaxID=318479 RepID=A0A0N4UCC9_DRAME|nr:unnamed protein product [Dracunculus medinensis]
MKHLGRQWKVYNVTKIHDLYQCHIAILLQYFIMPSFRNEVKEEYPKCFIVGVDNVGSKQMQEIRHAMRGLKFLFNRDLDECKLIFLEILEIANGYLGHAEILMGKNTMIRKAIRGHLSSNPDLEKLMPHIVGNVGFVFTKEDLSDIRNKLLENRRASCVGAPAKAGAIAPCDVKLPPQNTGMGPEKTSFFQALQIPTKISRGTIEILNEVHLIKVGEKVGASEAALLNMLNIQPFTYGLVVQQEKFISIIKVYENGMVFSPNVLDVTAEDIRSRFLEGVRNVVAVSLSIGHPTMCSISHSIVNGLKNLLAIAVETDIDFKEAHMIKEYLANPSKFPVSSATSAPASSAA